MPSRFRGGAAALLAFLPTSTLAQQNCLEPESVVNPKLELLAGGQELVGALKTDYGPIHVREVRFDFKEVTIKGRPVVQIAETVRLDFSSVIDGVRADAYSSARESQTCNRLMNPHSFSLAPTEEGNLAGDLSIGTTFRECQIFDVPCHKGGLEFGMCRVQWSEDLFDHTFGVNVAIRREFCSETDLQDAQAAAYGANPQSPATAADIICQRDDLCSSNASGTGYVSGHLCGSSEFDRRGFDISKPIPNFLLNLIGIVTLNAGSKFILDGYRSAMNQATDEVNRSFSANLPSKDGLVGSEEAASFLEAMVVLPNDTKFGYSSVGSSRKYVAFNYVLGHPEGSGVQLPPFCSQIRPVVAQYGALLRSTVTGDVTVEIKAGDTLWSLAEEAYGSGYYYLSLLPANDIPYAEANLLAPGREIVLPAMYKLWNREQATHLTAMGDSLWSIAGRELGEHTSYGRIHALNERYLESADRIYPVQVLELGNGVAQ